MVYKVLRYPNSILETPCEPITEFDTLELHKLVDDMFETTYASKGVGLAAPQIGSSLRIVYINARGRSFHLLNPVIAIIYGITNFRIVPLEEEDEPADKPVREPVA